MFVFAKIIDLHEVHLRNTTRNIMTPKSNVSENQTEILTVEKWHSKQKYIGELLDNLTQDGYFLIPHRLTLP